MRRFVVVLVAVAVLIVGAWVSIVWVPGDGAVWGWSSASGTLKVLGHGPAWLPRWSYARRTGGVLAAEVAAASREGVGVVTSVEVRPAVGTVVLAPAVGPSEGLAIALAADVRGLLATTPVGCLVPGVRLRAGDCPRPAAESLREAIAARLGVSAAAVAVDLAPDAGAMRGYILGQVRSTLFEPARRVLVIGLDAIDWELVLPLVDSGRMPTMRRLLESGTWGEMNTIVPMLSPLIWTTMATGVGPEEHGILDFVQKDPETGQLLPVTGRERRVPAIWNIAAALGRSVDVVGWWATWPAERVSGTMVSDRLYYTLTQGIDSEVLRDDPPDLVSPDVQAPTFVELRDRIVRDTDWQVMRHFIDVPREEFEKALAADRGWEDPIDGTRRVVAATRTYFAAADVLARRMPDLLLVYIEGTDEIAHILAPYMPPPLIDVPAAEAATFAAAVPRYFEDVDRLMGKLMESCPPSECAVLVLSDHGFKWGADRPTKISGTAGPTAPLWHDDHAAFLLSGKGVPRRGRVAESGSVYDVAPTLAALLALPPGTGWRGRPLAGCEDPGLAPLDYSALLPPHTYAAGGGAPTPVDAEYIAKLQSLGYLSGSSSEPAPSRSQSGPAPAIPEAAATMPPGPATSPDSTTRGELNNLAVIKMKEKKFDEAEDLLRRAIQMSPGYAAPHYNLRHLYMEERRYDEADAQLWVAVDKGLRDPERSVDRAAADYEGLDLPERADALLVRALERFPEHEPLWVHALVVKLRLDRCDEGVLVGGRAASRFPASAPVHAFYGLAAACATRLDIARSELSRSLELNPDQPRLRQALAALGAASK